MPVLSAEREDWTRTVDDTVAQDGGCVLDALALAKSDTIGGRAGKWPAEGRAEEEGRSLGIAVTSRVDGMLHKALEASVPEQVATVTHDGCSDDEAMEGGRTTTTAVPLSSAAMRHLRDGSAVATRGREATRSAPARAVVGAAAAVVDSEVATSEGEATTETQTDASASAFGGRPLSLFASWATEKTNESPTGALSEIAKSDAPLLLRTTGVPTKSWATKVGLLLSLSVES